MAPPISTRGLIDCLEYVHACCNALRLPGLVSVALHGPLATQLDPDSQGADGTLALFQAKLTTKLQAAGSNVDDQRTAALAALKEELAADVRTMREAVQAEDRETYNEVWQGILGLRLSNIKKRSLIQTIRGQVLAGENRIAWQDVDRLTRPL